MGSRGHQRRAQIRIGDRPMPPKRTAESAPLRATYRPVLQVLRMQGNSRAQAVTLKLPTRPGNRDGAPGSKSGACAPTHHRRAKAPTGGKQVDRPAVLAKTEAAGTRCQMRVVASQPGW